MCPLSLPIKCISNQMTLTAFCAEVEAKPCNTIRAFINSAMLSFGKNSSWILRERTEDHFLDRLPTISRDVVTTSTKDRGTSWIFHRSVSSKENKGYHSSFHLVRRFFTARHFLLRSSDKSKRQRGKSSDRHSQHDATPRTKRSKTREMALLLRLKKQRLHKN